MKANLRINEESGCAEMGDVQRKGCWQKLHTDGTLLTLKVQGIKC